MGAGPNPSWRDSPPRSMKTVAAPRRVPSPCLPHLTPGPSPQSWRGVRSLPSPPRGEGSGKGSGEGILRRLRRIFTLRRVAGGCGGEFPGELRECRCGHAVLTSSRSGRIRRRERARPATGHRPGCGPRTSPTWAGAHAGAIVVGCMWRVSALVKGYQTPTADLGNRHAQLQSIPRSVFANHTNSAAGI
jgi:hypothetical protein